jgi:hypothetical protein
MAVSLPDMKKGETGKVVALCGGRGFQRNMESSGNTMYKIAQQFGVILQRKMIFDNFIKHTKAAVILVALTISCDGKYTHHSCYACNN